MESSSYHNNGPAVSGVDSSLMSKRHMPILAMTADVIHATYEDQKSIDPGHFECHWGIFTFDGLAKYALNLITMNTGALVLAKNVQYLEHKWCILKPSAKLDYTLVGDNVSYACGLADCTNLGYGTSCSNLDALGNASYAFNSYFQTNDRNDIACKFSNLGMITKSDPSTGSCRFIIMIDLPISAFPRRRLISSGFLGFAPMTIVDLFIVLL